MSEHSRIDNRDNLQSIQKNIERQQEIEGFFLVVECGNLHQHHACQTTQHHRCSMWNYSSSCYTFRIQQKTKHSLITNLVTGCVFWFVE